LKGKRRWKANDWAVKAEKEIENDVVAGGTPYVKGFNQAKVILI